MRRTGQAALALLLVSGPVAAQADSRIAAAVADDASNAWRADDLRVASVGERLAVTALPLCRQPVARSGIALHYLAQYAPRSRRQLSPLFPVNEAPAILLIVPGSAADRAGLRADDGLIAADGNALPRERPGRTPTSRTLPLALAALDVALSDGHADLTVRRGRHERRVALTGTAGCATHFLTRPSASLDAEADGRFVQVTSANVALAADDAELAATLAHELAHNILRHRERLNAAGVQRGLAGQFGRNAALIRASEIEADRLSVWIMALAGYPPDAALRLLERRAARIGPVLATTHPGWDRRRAIIAEQIALIDAVRAQNRPLVPPFDTSGDTPLMPDD